MKLFTIGFSGKSAETFFGRLRDAGVRELLDIRLNPSGQLSGFAKDRDLPYFLRELCGIQYQHLAILAPPRTLLEDYRNRRMEWCDYEKTYLAAMRERNACAAIDTAVLKDACLLCSEDSPVHCHRRLAAEYLASHYGEIVIHHL